METFYTCRYIYIIEG